MSLAPVAERNESEQHDVEVPRFALNRQTTNTADTGNSSREIEAQSDASRGAKSSCWSPCIKFFSPLFVLALANLMSSSSIILRDMTDVGPFASAMWSTLGSIPLFLLAWGFDAAVCKQLDEPFMLRSRFDIILTVVLLIIAGAGTALSTVFLSLSESRMSFQAASVLYNIQIVFVPTLSYFAFGEQFTYWFVGGITLCFGGLVLLTLGPAVTSGDIYKTFSVFSADAEALLAGLCSAITTIAAKKARERSGVGIVTVTMSISSLVVITGLAIIEETDQLLPAGTKAWLTLSIMAVVGVFGALRCSVWAMRYVPASTVAAFTMIGTAWVAVLTWIFMHAEILPIQIVGVVCICVGLVLVRIKSSSTICGCCSRSASGEKISPAAVSPSGAATDHQTLLTGPQRS